MQAQSHIPGILQWSDIVKPHKFYMKQFAGQKYQLYNLLGAAYVHLKQLYYRWQIIKKTFVGSVGQWIAS